MTWFGSNALRGCCREDRIAQEHRHAAADLLDPGTDGADDAD